MKRLPREDRAGLYTTIIIHLVVIIILLASRLGAELSRENSFVLDFTKAEQMERLQQQLEFEKSVNERLNQLLAETAHDAGVITNEEFAIFQNAGYMGLYGGLDVDDIHSKKKLSAEQKILDFMGSTELIANLFRISQTEEKLRKDNIIGAEKATSTHYAVGREVRKAIEKIGGTMPEDLPTPEKSIQQIEKEQMERLKKKAKAGKIMLDE